MIITRTPFRVSFFGGGTDYPTWYREHGGAVLATTIDKYCYLSCRNYPPFFNEKYRIVYSETELTTRICDVKHPSVRACLDYAKPVNGVEVVHNADLPARSGLGSSSSFTVGLLHGLYALQGTMASKERLAKEAIHVEQDLLAESVGDQDQVLAAYGGLNHVTFSERGHVVNPIPIRQERQRALEENLLLFFSGKVRFSSEIAAAQIANIPKRHAELTAMLALVDDGVSIITGDGDIDDFGRLLHETWMLKRRLACSISTSKIDEMYEAARSCGALGGKLLGAGGGGFLLIYAPPDTQPRIREILKDYVCVPIKFENCGTQLIHYGEA